jgi:DeoR family glycerol-3-phosphate regulon repressor
MRPHDRQSRITDMVHSQGKVSVDQLVEAFHTSAETIRRDLTFLAANGKIQKIHGGAIPLRNFGEGPFAQRMQSNGQAKRLIAQQVRKLVSPGDSLFIDTGSTTLVIAEELAAIDDLIVITNSAEIARVITSANKTVQMFLVGGNYNGDNRQTCGTMAVDQLGNFHGNIAMLTAGAISAGAGVMDFSHDEAQIASAMIEHSDKVLLMVDSSKFDRVAPFAVTSFDRIDTLVSDQAPGGALADALDVAQVEIVC